MKYLCTCLLALILGLTATPAVEAPVAAPIPKLAYNNPGLRTDLGIGLWGTPLPMDFNHDGKMDLIMVGTGVPSKGTYFFENSGEIDPMTHLPIFKAGVLLGKPAPFPSVSYVRGQAVVTSKGAVYPDFEHSGFAHPVALPAPTTYLPASAKVRTTQMRLADYDGDGRTDLIVGVDAYGDYGWDNAYDAKGNWKNGPLHGYVFVLRNRGSDERPDYAPPEQIMAGGHPVDVYGMVSPCFGDFRGIGKLDLICGEFRGGFTYFENIGSRAQPVYAPGRKLQVAGVELMTDQCMITPVAVDFSGHGHLDLIVGDEDGRVSLLENTGKVVDGMPQFLPPRYFAQEADKLKMGSLSAPVAADWYGSGREDLMVGDGAGYIAVFRNLGGNPPRWAAPVYLAAGGQTIRIQAGPSGSIQGPAETRFGYTNLSVADWDGDGRLDILCNDIWGKIVWFRNVGTRTHPQLAPAEPIEVEWAGSAPKPAWNWWQPKGKALVTQWRSTPCVIDLNGDGLPDLVTLDPEGYLALYERRLAADGRRRLLPPQRVFWGDNVSAYNESGVPLNHTAGWLRMNANEAGHSGRRTFCFVDWDGDGIMDLLVNGRPNVNFLKGRGRDSAGRWVFHDMGPVHPELLVGHSTTPTIVHWDSGRPDLVFGAEDGFLYYLRNPWIKTAKE